MSRIAVLGGGSWGTALSEVLADNAHSVTVYERKGEKVSAFNAHVTPDGLFERVFPLNPSIRATSSLKEAFMDAEFLLLSVPSTAYRSVLNEALPYIVRPVSVISTGKGFDPTTHHLLNDTVKEILPQESCKGVTALTGPSFAEEVIAHGLTCVLAANENTEEAKKVQRLFSNPYFRVYTSSDPVGAQVAGALKNVIALASGMLCGLGYSENAKAALLTRGEAEISRLGKALGGKEETFLGLGGFGDLILTCSSFTSRNFTSGYEIGKADSASEFLEHNTKTVEGIEASRLACSLGKKYSVELPITEAVYSVLFEGRAPSSIAKELMQRELKAEF
jgi:glycerol-3-phosphate dehydrogenase (NAD(P)+)